MGGAYENVPGCSKTVNHEEEFPILDGEIYVKCYHTPCHTRGHVLYYLEADGDLGCQRGMEHESKMDGEYMIVSNVNRCVLTGDTVFIGGCGKFMEGDAKDMLKAMDIVMTLPSDTKIFCGHEYTKENLEFCLQAEQNHTPIAEAYEKFTNILDKGMYTVPSILREEKEYNVFMRCRTKFL